MTKRLRTAFFLISIIALLLGPLAVGALNRLIDAQVQTTIPLLAQPTPAPAEPACVPPVDQAVLDLAAGLVPGQVGDSTASLQMTALFAADQAARIPGTDPKKLNSADTERRIEVLAALQNGETFSPRDLVYAAYIFQHGDCPEHYQLANRLAQAALDAGDPEAHWIFAATLDRYLMSLGEPQKFGTQSTWVDGAYQLYPVDPSTTDAERAQYDVPPLSEAVSKTSAGIGSGGSVRRQWLESWWLTWIGAGFAALSVVLSLVAPQPNSRLGIVVLAVALAVYGVSAFGHYAQVQALVQGTAAAQQKIWAAANLLALLAWLAFAGLAAFRWMVHLRKAA